MSARVDDIPELIADILDNYSTDLREAVNKTTEQAANELKKAITADAPVKSGKQKRSWRVTKNKVAGIDLVAVVHSTDYRKVHLLEFGHVIRDGTGRKVGETKAIGYIAKNEEAIVSKYPERLAQAIRTVK